MASNRPYAHEIVAAVRQFVTRDPLGNSDVTVYQRRIAGNLLGILERELQQGPAAWRRERKRLARWLGEDLPGGPEACNRQLCERIRAGELDGDARLFEHLCATVYDKLAIDNPRYSTWLHWRRQREPGK